MNVRWALAVMAAVAMGPASAQWGPIHDEPPSASDEGDVDGDEGGGVVVFDADDPEPRRRRSARGERSPASSTGALGLSASLFGGYRGLARTEGRGFDATFGHGARVGLEPRPSIALDLAYAGGRRSGGTAGLGSRSHYHSLLLLPGWQHRESAGVYGVGAGVAATWTRVDHHWRDGEGIGVWAFDPGPALHGTMKWRFTPLEIRLDAMGVWRSRQLDLLVTLGIGLFQSGNSEG